MVQYIITPWRVRRDLLLVRQQFYPAAGDSIDSGCRQAVSQVSVWMQRGNCPHLVESTAILTSAILNDGLGNSSYCVRAAYSAAFCRFVTGLLDGYQDKRRKLSMYSIAKSIGLPATYVELRHQATHEELPSLPKLRTAAQKALSWIWGYYWVHISTEAPEIKECKGYLQKFLVEEDVETRLGMEAHLKDWDEDLLLNTLIEIQDETEDTRILLRSTKLFETVLSWDKTSESSGISAPSTPTENIDQVKADLDRIAQDLSVSKNETSEDLDMDVANTTAPQAKGWSRWQGPWIPKPIGAF